MKRSRTPTPKPAAIVRQKSSDPTLTEASAEKDGDENSFTPLVNAKAVSFTGTREIETFDDNACRVRLSKGQVRLEVLAASWIDN